VTCSSGGFYCGEEGTGNTTIMEKLHSTLLGNRIKCELVGPSNRNGCKSIFSVLTTAADFQKILTDPKNFGLSKSALFEPTHKEWERVSGANLAEEVVDVLLIDNLELISEKILDHFNRFVVIIVSCIYFLCLSIIHSSTNTFLLIQFS
jgi:hypothetical protein